MREANRGPWLARPTTLAIAVGILTIALNIMFSVIQKDQPLHRGTEEVKDVDG